jgi:uncharacterized DUF497 family protein
MTFEWDESKNRENEMKHGISFEDAQHAFLDIKRVILHDEKHSDTEQRFFCIGKIVKGIATVRFTMRDSNIRIFGAGLWREGKKIYEESL